MIIKTITCHDVYNLGASLQAYALQKYLENKGHEVEIIDYKPNYLSGHFKLWGVYNPIFDKPIIKQLYLIAKLPGRIKALKRKKAFDEFTKNHLKLTKRYHSNEELKNDCPKADVYIAGSDQIWNTLFPNGKDPAFYLDFVPQGKKKISYAASFATKDIADDLKPFVRRMLSNLDSVSIREKSSLPLLASLGRPDGVAVCDPVFLLEKREWEKIVSQSLSFNKDYVLTYDFESNSTIKEIALRLKKEKGLKIYNVGPFIMSYADKNYVNAGPLEFLSLISHSSFVISNSFHATAFSIIFNKEFCVVNREEEINNRMESLLTDLHLIKRLVTGFHLELLNNINHDDVQLLLHKYVDNSKKYLDNSLI